VVTDDTAVETMLADGASHREIHRTLGIDRGTLARRWPGTGWTYTQAGAFGGALRGNRMRPTEET
jgi:DNA invertase Pin-like site-specific DNA recombinase